jgi:solute carrier family 50 (sugar transporter)
MENYVSYLGSILSILLFLSPLKLFYKLNYEINPFPFYIIVLSSSLWFSYGYFLNIFAVMISNMTGIIFGTLYVYLSYQKSTNKNTIIRDFTITLVFFVVVIFLMTTLFSEKDLIDNLGLLCCIFNVIAFASPLVNLKTVLLEKNSESLPGPLIVMSFLCSIVWYYFGVLVEDSFIKIPNLIGIFLSTIQLFLKIYFGKHDNSLKETLNEEKV